MQNINSAVEPSLTQQSFLQQSEVLQLTLHRCSKNVVQAAFCISLEMCFEIRKLLENIKCALIPKFDCKFLQRCSKNMYNRSYTIHYTTTRENMN